MKAESNIRPEPFVIDKIGEDAIVSFFTEVIETEKEGETAFEYNHYTLSIPYRNGIQIDINDNYKKWLEMAIGQESKESPETTKEKVYRLEKENENLKLTLADLAEVILLGGT